MATRISESIRGSVGAISVEPAKAKQVLLHIDPVSLDLAMMAIASRGVAVEDLERLFEMLVPGLARQVRYELELLQRLGYVVVVSGCVRVTEKGRYALKKAGIRRPIDALRLLMKALGWWVVRDCLRDDACSELLRTLVGDAHGS